MTKASILALSVWLLTLCSLARAQAPWLPESEQKYLRALIPDGVPFSGRAKLYKIRQVYQSLYSVSGKERRDIVAVTAEDHPWKVSGGMHWTDSSEWRNATALDIPDGAKIVVWGQRIDAGAFVPVQKVFWQFPVGTIAYDVLIRRVDPERVFEVRTHERTRGGWANAHTYRPDVSTDQSEKKTWRWQFSNNVIFGSFQQSVTIDAASRVKLVPPIPVGVKFVPRDDIPHDGGYLVPKDYVGTGTSCASCHSNSLVGHRTGYGTAIRGGDGRFSWHPFDDSGGIDWRWPVEEWNTEGGK